MLKISRNELASLKLDLRTLVDNAPVCEATKRLLHYIEDADCTNKTILTIGIKKEGV